MIYAAKKHILWEQCSLKCNLILESIFSVEYLILWEKQEKSRQLHHKYMSFLQADSILLWKDIKCK